jgi:Domain of unknown function (DUF3597)
MSILGTIISKIFHGPSAPPAATPSPTTTAAPTPADAPKPAAQAVDVEEVLDGLADNASQELDWRHSIVDLMKLLNLDSGLAARKELAKELHYSGDTNDSAAMNIWLHKQVMIKLAENGGKVPADLRT